MNEANVIVPTSNVEGNITNCKIENQLLSIDRKSAFSVTETRNYITYDVCNKQELARYSMPEFTGNGGIGVFILFLILFAVITHNITKY